MNFPRTIEEVKGTADRLCAFLRITGIGTSNRSDMHFHEPVFSTAHRLQCLHHAVVFSVENVLSIVAKRSSMGNGEIIFATLLHFRRYFVAINYIASKG